MEIQLRDTTSCSTYHKMCKILKGIVPKEDKKTTILYKPLTIKSDV